jgi:hypothetical protein
LLRRGLARSPGRGGARCRVSTLHAGPAKSSHHANKATG